MGLDGGRNANFFPIASGNEFVLETYQKKFQCVDSEDMQIYGDFNSPEARLMEVQLI